MAESHESRRQELLAVLRDRRVDVIPATSYGVDRYSHPWMAQDPSYARWLAYSDSREHIFAYHLSYYASFGLTDALWVEDPALVERTVTRDAAATHTALRLRTPKGDLTARYTENDGVRTVWRHDLLMKSDDDMDRFLAARFAPKPPDVAAFAAVRDALGDRGVMEIELPSPLCLVVENMNYEDFMVRTVFQPAKIDALLDRAAELICAWLEGLLRAGMGPVFRIFGPEYAAPPVMSPASYRRYVTRYDR
jgi:hypothetical protein